MNKKTISHGFTKLMSGKIFEVKGRQGCKEYLKA
jgi:hypothetical protein